MELGGNIELKGFTEDPNDLVIIKKIVGNFTKKLTEELPDFQRLVLTAEGSYTLIGEIQADKNLEAKNTDDNFYFALDGCLKSLEDQVMKT